MCGLVVGSPEDAEYGLIKLAHRGIRGNINFLHGVHDLAVGHVRLPIVGLGQEYDQPWQDSKWLIAFVGEILDFKEWCTYECDTPLVMDTWTTEGPHGFRKFDGFWSIAALDKQTGEVHLLVDYLAQKPLYYRTDFVAVASEPNAILHLEPVTRDEIYFSSVVKWGYCPETWRTPYREIWKTLPGEHIVLKNTGQRQAATIEDLGKVIVKREIVDTLEPMTMSWGDIKTEILAAIKRRVLSSDVPVAALVSGGLDSAIVYTIAKKYGPVHAYHVENDEALAASAVVGTDKITQLDYRAVSLVRAMDYMQEPIDLGSLLPQVAISEAIARADKERVCLTGDGADELFGGYGRAMRYDSQWSDIFHELVAWHLPRLDRVMMRNLIEVRSPFLAREVVEGALALPWADRRDKKILRELFRDDLPKGIADRPKKALRTPTIERDRETNTKMLVDIFRKKMQYLRVVG